MLSQSLESCCIIAFNTERVLQSSQRLLSQTWVLIKVLLNRSLSLIKPSITTNQETKPQGKKENRTPHVVMWGAGAGAGRKEEEP